MYQQKLVCPKKNSKVKLQKEKKYEKFQKYQRTANNKKVGMSWGD